MHTEPWQSALRLRNNLDVDGANLVGTPPRLGYSQCTSTHMLASHRDIPYVQFIKIIGGVFVLQNGVTRFSASVSNVMLKLSTD